MEITTKDVTIEQRVNGSRMHKFSVPALLDEDQARELQMDMGYHPCGYGFYRFEPSDNLTTWLCGDSCD